MLPCLHVHNLVDMAFSLNAQPGRRGLFPEAQPGSLLPFLQSYSR